MSSSQGGVTSIFGGGGSASQSNANSGGSVGSIGPLNSTTTTSADAGNYRRPKVCDATGQNCKCINLASFGDRASKAYGTGSDGQASSTTSFETWLEEKSNANVTMVFEDHELTPDYLNGFDVIILQDLRKWNLSNTEIGYLKDWVEGGGGLIALNGYFNDDDAEVTASNAVLSTVTGMTYNGGAQSGSVPDGSCPATSQKLCPQATSACCYCWNNTIPILDWDTSHDVTKNVTAVGAYYGRSINAGDGKIVATYSGKTVAASKTIGNGKAFLWCDEWITYTSQWSGGQTTGPEDQYQPCYVASANPPHWMTADYAFQTMQFWYNMVTYVSPPTECNFVINEPEHVILL
jgi:hypothetical protein